MDQNTGDVYIIDQAHGGVSIFNKHGMETYQFGHASDLGDITGLDVDKDGNIWTLSYYWGTTNYYIGFCDFRGKLKRKINVTGLPSSGFAVFQPNELFIRGGHIYLVDMGHLLVAQVNRKGACLKAWNISHIMGWDKLSVRTQMSAFGFTIDQKGNMFFTIPTSFRAFKMTPEGKVTGFGQGGDGPGKFGVAAGVAVDTRGYIYIADKLRCVVLIFNKDLRFVREFGYRGYGLGGLIVPTAVAMDRTGTLYVAQGGNRGVDVFRMGYD
ncbi:MAG: hypothetical protein M0018_07200 [Nitrospiraceae bacterium]|nr:hypothetical protein [Nitrospiraceae bacterium]